MNKKVSKANVQKRLDRFVTSESWCDLFPRAVVEHIEFSKFDHQPIALYLAGKPRQKKNKLSSLFALSLLGLKR